MSVKKRKREILVRLFNGLQKKGAGCSGRRSKKAERSFVWLTAERNGSQHIPL